MKLSLNNAELSYILALIGADMEEDPDDDFFRTVAGSIATKINEHVSVHNRMPEELALDLLEQIRNHENRLWRRTQGRIKKTREYYVTHEFHSKILRLVDAGFLKITDSQEEYHCFERAVNGKGKALFRGLDRVFLWRDEDHSWHCEIDAYVYDFIQVEAIDEQ